MAAEEEVGGAAWEVGNPFLRVERKQQQRNRLSCPETHRGAPGAGGEEEEGAAVGAGVKRLLET